MPRLTTIVVLLAAIGCGPTHKQPTREAAPAPETVQAAPVEQRPGLNDRFLDPEMEVDDWVERFEAESREVVLRQPQVLQTMNLQPGTRIADIGAGTGLYVRPFAEAVGPEGAVYAVEISPRFLDLLRTTSEQAGWSQVQVVEGTERSPELAEGSVDVVFICDTYHHFDYPAQMLQSLHRALSPGGVIYLLDFKRVEGESSDWIMGHVRAGQEVFAAEIIEAGFIGGGVLDAGLEENYLLRFEKAPA
jgi:SAM-dependent methyltransferase